MMQGTVSYWNQERFFGFVQSDNGMKFFAHGRAFLDPAEADAVQAGQRVRFEGGHDDRGPRAESVEILPEAAPALT
jgi:cold shock CspA family protein